MAATGTNVITVHLAQRAEWSLTGDKRLLCVMAFSGMVTMVGVKTATGQKESSPRTVLS